jgi:hypothetical protein
MIEGIRRYICAVGMGMSVSGCAHVCLLLPNMRLVAGITRHLQCLLMIESMGMLIPDRCLAIPDTPGPNISP